MNKFDLCHSGFVFLIFNYKENPLSESLLYHIQAQSPFLVSTNDSRNNKKSVGSWIISLNDGVIIISGWNNDFG